MKQFLFFGILLLNVAFFAEAQTQQSIADSVQLQAVEVTESRLQQFHTGQTVEALDSAVLQSSMAQNLSDLLEENSSLFVKTYGLGSLASTNIRGAGSSHTAVLWNGFNLQSSMNGLLDLALIPVHTTDNVQIQYGGSSALFGSGAIGGVIHLQNQPTFGQGKQASTSQTIGSFGKHFQSYSLDWSEKKARFSLQYYRQKANNDFKFTNTTLAAKPTQIQQNAALKQEGILQQNYLKIGDKHQLGLQFWFQNTERKIPPTLLAAASKSKQSDIFYRTALNWKSLYAHRSLEARIAFFYEELRYTDPAIQLIANNHSKAAIAEVEHKWQFSPSLQWQLGFNYTHDYARTDGYEGIGFSRNRTSAFTALKSKILSNRMNVVLSSRGEIVDGKTLSPIVPALGLEYQLKENWLLKGHFSRNYRLPTFNDLFWMPGGNADLKAELAWNQEIGVDGKFFIHELQSSIRFNVFNSNIKDWIIWLPTNGGLYSPSNLQEVWSRGLEAKGELQRETARGTWKIHWMYAYTHTTNQKARFANDQAVGKQLIYVPLHTAKASFTYKYRLFEAKYTHQFIGKRYTNTDNSNALPAYQLGNFLLAKHVRLGKNRQHSAQLQLKANNLWNEDYQVIAFRPMPLRNWEMGLRFDFGEGK